MNKVNTIVMSVVVSLTLLGCSDDGPTDQDVATVLSDPWPAPAATDIATSPTLHWQCSGPDGVSLTHDVYFGTVNPPIDRVATGLTETTFSLAGLTARTTYYWKVNAIAGTSAAASSPVWSFTTTRGVVVPGLVTVAGGAFQAGSTTVTISSFKIDRYEVTYEMWVVVAELASRHGYTDLAAGQNGYNSTGANNPVTMVNWYDVVKWCNARSEKEGRTPVYYTDSTHATVYRTGDLGLNPDAVDWSADGYRLPTEAEWEFAARGGTSTRGYPYSGSDHVDDVAWYSLNSGNGAHAVGARSANELGLYDMSGNAGEWCWDWHAAAYPAGGTTDPRGPATSQTFRIVRGGFFIGEEVTCHLATRAYDADGPGHRGVMGFRCIRR